MIYSKFGIWLLGFIIVFPLVSLFLWLLTLILPIVTFSWVFVLIVSILGAFIAFTIEDFQ